MKALFSTVLKEVERKLATRMDTRNFFIALYDSERNWIQFLVAIHDGEHVAVGEPESPPLYQDRLLKNDLIEYVIRNCKPLLIEENLDERVKALGIEVVPAEVKCWIGAPMIVGNHCDSDKKVLGIIGAQNFERAHVFDKRQLSLLRNIANQAAIALEKERLYQERKERAARLEELQRVTADISAEPSNLEGVLQTIVNSLRNMFPSASCAIRLYDPENGEFKEHVAAGKLEDCSFPPRRRGTSRYIIANKKPYYVKDATAPRPKGQPRIRKEVIECGVRAAAYLPLIREEKVIGLLHLDLMVPHLFSQNEKLILELFANQAAAAVENARLRQDLQSRLVRAERFVLGTGFAANYIHRVNNLIGTIPIRVERISEKLAASPLVYQEIKPYLDGIVSDVKGVHPLTEQVTDLTRQEPRKERIDVSDTLVTVARRARNETLAEIDLQETYPEEPLYARAVAWELSNAFWNVLRNGVEAMEEDGKGTLSLRVAEIMGEEGQSWIEIRIHNTGPKINERIIDRIFDPFFSTKTENTGYGLWRTRQTVQSIGGTICVANDDNNESNGVSMIIHLPIYDERAGQDAQ